MPEAPLAGALKVTLAPETGLPYASVTVASSGLVKPVLTSVDCPDPEVATIVLGKPAVTVTGVEPQLLEPFAALMDHDPTASSP